MPRRHRPLTAVLGAAGVIAATAFLPAVSSAHPRRARRPASQVLFRTHYPSSGNATQVHGTGWEAAQVPDDDGHVEDSRITFGPAPGIGEPRRPRGSVARFTLHPFRTRGRLIGDTTDTGGLVANRVEVYGRIAHRETPVDRWPDPIGSTRWYAFSIYLPSGFTTATRSTQWFDFVQWKGLNTGSPPVAMEIRGDEFVLGGANSHAHLGYLHTGTWTHFVVGLHFSDVGRDGWATVYRDGVRVLDRQPTQTMNSYWDSGAHAEVVDPDYLKMGIYRSVTWTTTQTIWLSSLTIGTTFASVR